MSDRGFTVGEFSDRVEVLVTGPWSSDAARPFESGEADRLVLNYAHGFGEPDLEFLRDLPIRQLVIVDRRLESLEPVHALGDTLELLHVTTQPSLEVNLSKLPRVTDLSADWEQVQASVSGASSLERLSLGRYGQPDLAPLAGLQLLRRLMLADRPRLRSLTGLIELSAIEVLGIFLAKNLTDFSDLQGRSDLVELELEGCRKLGDLDHIAECTGLRRLNLSECGDISSVAPLAGLTQLEHLRMFGTTKVADGDLTPIAELPLLKDLRMQSRRHYRPSVQEIQARLPRV